MAVAGQRLLDRARNECDRLREFLAPPSPAATSVGGAEGAEGAECGAAKGVVVTAEISLSMAHCASPPFLVPLDRYMAAVKKPWMAAFRVRCATVVTSTSADGSVRVGEVQGVVMGCAPLSEGRLLPWRCLYVTWDPDEGGALRRSRTSPWELDQR